MKEEIDWEKQQRDLFKQMTFTAIFKVVFGDFLSDEEINKIAEKAVAAGGCSLGEQLIKEGKFELYNQSTGHVLAKGRGVK